jgi:ATP phosphoribosyltransferase
MKLRLGLPKGSLEEQTIDLFRKAGFAITYSGRSYFPAIDDPEIEPVLMRAQEMARFVGNGGLDCGVTGHDWILENGADVVEVAELCYSKATQRPARWVLAVPVGSDVQTAEDLAGKTVATELVNMTRQYFESKGVDLRVEFSWGATEAKVPDLVDAIVDVTETGRSLAANGLRIVDTVLESTTRFIANKDAYADPWKRTRIDNISVLVRGALEARGMVGLKMNVAKDKLENVLDVLPALRNPTVAPLSKGEWVDVDTVIDEAVVRKLIPELLKAGAEGIVEYPLNKIIR